MYAAGAGPDTVGLLSVGEQHDPGSVAFRLFLIAGAKDGVHRISQSYVRSIIHVLHMYIRIAPFHHNTRLYLRNGVLN